MSAHRPVQAANLPLPAGPYSPAQVFERLVFVSGQGATDPLTGRLAGDDIESQTEQVLVDSVRRLATAAGRKP